MCWWLEIIVDKSNNPNITLCSRKDKSRIMVICVSMIGLCVKDKLERNEKREMYDSD